MDQLFDPAKRPFGSVLRQTVSNVAQGASGRMLGPTANGISVTFSAGPENHRVKDAVLAAHAVPIARIEGQAGYDGFWHRMVSFSAAVIQYSQPGVEHNARG